MPEKITPYWFHAKRYGWGWGLPARREGWIVLICWLLILTAVGIFIAPKSLLIFLVILFAMAALLFAICYAKGEPPRWRWGKP